MDIEAQELKSKLDQNESFHFIDVREAYEYEADNLGAELIPLGNVMDIVANYADQKSEEFVIHCRSGARSGSAQKILQDNGFSNVRNLLGGILAYRQMYPI